MALSNTPLEDRCDVVPVSVILPVAGADRISIFQGTLASLLAQDCGSLEIIVAEQGKRALYRHDLPHGVKHILIPPNRQEDGFNKSRAFNAGVRAATAPVVLLHDADTVVPRSYIRTILDRLQSGWEAVRPLRFLFCMERDESERFVGNQGAALPSRVSAVMQNFPGCSIAVRREVYWRIGGHDERFVGWGGEDLEFLDRLKTTRLFAGGYAPAIHLWHPHAAKKANGDRNNGLMEQLRAEPVGQRIERLRSLATEAAVCE